MSVSLLLLITVSILQAECARILGIIPVASYSHQMTFQPLWKELSLRGHQMTVMTTNPMNDPSLKNLTEIDLSYTYEIYNKHNFAEFMSDDTRGFKEVLTNMLAMIEEATDFQFRHPQVQELIHDKRVEFDLVIVEAQLPDMIVFSWRFNCPAIGITSLDAALHFHLALGNPAHPIVNPDYNLPVKDTEDLSFWERISSLLFQVIYMSCAHFVGYSEIQAKLKKVFGSEVPDLVTLYDNMVVLFINTHPIFHNIRPLNPNTIAIGGGIHIKKRQPLPQDIQNYLDNAGNGAIYFSLGTNVNGRMLSAVMPGILKALSEVPYRVLLKTDLVLENVPENVAIHKWLPQQDILRHPNLKLFITQGGLQSLQEAVYNAVPLIGIPFFGDQIVNVNRMAKKGYGVKVDKNNITRESLKEAILEVMNNPKYREKAKELCAIYRDEEVPSLQRVIWWTEYVIRHKDSRHFRSPVLDMSLWKYFMLDTIGFLLLILMLSLFICYKALKCILRLFIRRDYSKMKTQ